MIQVLLCPARGQLALRRNIMNKTILLAAAVLLIGAMPASSARISSVSGKPEIQSSAAAGWKAAGKGDKLHSNARIRCGKSSRAEIITDNGHRIKVWPRSEVALEKIDGAETRMQLFAWRIRSMVKKLRGTNKFEVKTPVAVCSVRGTDFSVELDKNATKVEVYEGQVAAHEEMTGSEVMVNAGQYTSIEANQPPAEPKAMPEGAGEQAPALTPEEAAREESKREVFQEISKDEVLARAADEIKLAEFQNGKALIDASGHRVRLEEYIVRSQANEFKYVVLNTRDEFADDPANPGNGHFNFGKIVFTFNDTLPDDLTQATRNMFYSEGATKQSLYLTDVLSVMSNTVDQVNDVASGGNMFPDNTYQPKSYTLGFGSYEFSVNNQPWWRFSDRNSNGRLDNGEITYYNIATGNAYNFSTDYTYDSTLGQYYYTDANNNRVYFSEFSQPSGPDALHFYNKNNYSAGQWIATDDYIINDEGKILTVSDIQGLSSPELKAKAYESNFERVYAASVFEGRKIDLVFSAKLLIDSGMLGLPDPNNLGQ